MKIVSLVAMVGALILVSGCIDEPKPNRGDGAKMHHFKENPYPSIADKIKDPHPGVVYLNETDLGKAKKPSNPKPNMIDVNTLNRPVQNNTTHSLKDPINPILQ